MRKRILKYVMLLRTAARLGYQKVFAVMTHKLLLKARIHPSIRLRAKFTMSPLFPAVIQIPAGQRVPTKKVEDSELILFGWLVEKYTEVPDWFRNVISDDTHSHTKTPWWLLADFDEQYRDIKGLWELSRFDWLIAMAQRAMLGESAEQQRLNAWLVDWMKNNPPYIGPNWKCGQEAGIRVIKVCCVYLMQGPSAQASESLLAFIELHLNRIYATRYYALGQSNNHATTESAALYVGGELLASEGIDIGRKLSDAGWHGLEICANKLIEADGSFSQYSVNYHRFALDTYSFVSAWNAQRPNARRFSNAALARLQKMTLWLVSLIEPNGRISNIGANDGALLLPMTSLPFDDFRASVQLASTVFLQACAIEEEGEWDQALFWLHLSRPSEHLDPFRNGVMLFDDGGYALSRNARASVILKYPRFNHRPSQCDALHCDVWLDGANIARDAGSYLYNSPKNDHEYFSGTAAHNTIEFDGSEQMPRISKFLFGAWLTGDEATAKIEGSCLKTSAGYRISGGPQHKRSLALSPERLVCEDEIDGFKKYAILRWRLNEDAYRIQDNTVRGEKFLMSFSGSAQFGPLKIVNGYESRFYGQKTALQVVEIRISTPGSIISEIVFISGNSHYM